MAAHSAAQDREVAAHSVDQDREAAIRLTAQAKMVVAAHSAAQAKTVVTVHSIAQAKMAVAPLAAPPQEKVYPRSPLRPVLE